MLSLARAWARWALKVLFPTPPFPDNTRILCLTVDNFSPISAIAGIKKWTDLWLQSINFPSQCEWNNHFGLKVTPSVQPVVCVSVVYLLPGSGALVAPEAHSFWLGQPWHDDDFPAWSLVVPGQSNRGEQNYWSIQEFLVVFFSIRNWKCLSSNTLDKMTALVIFLNK